jgi:hypothetical protein
VAVLATGLALGSASVALAAEMRTWTDESGQFQIEASLLRVEGGVVYLQRKNGAKMQIELKKLSPADQRYAAQHAATGEDPFRPAPDSVGATGTDAGRGGAKINWSTAKFLSSAPKGPWRFPVTSPPPEATVNLPTFFLAPKRDPGEKMTGLVLNPACRRAVIGYLWTEAEPEMTVRLILCNLQDGHAVERFGPGKLVPLALSNTGNQVLMRTEDSVWGHTCRLELWRLTSNGLQRALQWSPHEDEDRMNRNVTWGTFAGEGRLITLSSGGVLVVWQLEPLAPLGLLRVDGNCIPAVSPDGQHLVFATDGKVAVLEAKSGEVLAVQPMPKAMDPVFAFSPSGARLACAAGMQILVWDFQTGELCQTLEDMGRAEGRFLWTDEGHLLLDKHLLIGADCNLRLWDYRDVEDAAFCDGRCWLLARSHDTETLLPMQIPHADVENAIDKAMSQPDFFLLQPGSRVRLEVNAFPDATELEKARTALTEKLQANGFQVDPSSEIALVASVEREDKSELSVRGPFFAEGERTYKFQHYRSSLKFVYQGNTVWQRESTNAPHFIDRKLTETVEQSLKRREKPDYQLFQTVELPKTLVKSDHSGALGSSNVLAE